MVLFELADGISGDFSVVVKDGHGVEVLLAIEKHIKTGSSKIVETELERNLAEEGALWQEKRVYVQNLYLEFVVVQGWVKEHHYWRWQW